MKSVLILLTMLIFTNSYAFTSHTIFTCDNDDEVTVTTSLMPTGQWNNRSTSKYYGDLKSVKCDSIDSSWQMYGSQNCYSNENTVFSYFGQMGLIKLKLNNRVVFTLCEATQTIQ